MRKNSTDLPSTYIDWVRRMRPYLPEAVKAQLAALIEKGIGSDFETIDDLAEDNLLIDLFDTELWAEARRSASRLKLSTQDAYEYIRYERLDVAKTYLYVVNLDYNLLLRYMLAGSKLFHFMPGITNRLLHTDMNVPVESITMPYQSLAPIFDSTEVTDAFYAVCRQRAPKQNKGAITVFVSIYEHSGERRLSISGAHTHGDQCHYFAQRSLLLRAGWDAEQALKTDWVALGNPRDDMLDGTGVNILNSPDGDETNFYTDGLQFFRLVLNAVLYLGSHRPTLSRVRVNGPHAKADKLNYSMDEHVTVGEGITPISAPGETGVRMEDGSVAAIAQATKTVARILVMGHWKLQAHGPQRTLRKMIHIEPYWRGPDMAEAVSRPHVVH